MILARTVGGTEASTLTIQNAANDIDGEDFYMLKTTKWPDYYLYLQNNTEGTAKGWKNDPGPQGHFRFVKTENGYYHILSKEWETWYMYMQSNDDNALRAWEGPPGPQGEWKIISVEGADHYLLSPAEWEDSKYAYMDDSMYSNIHGCEGDPGEQGYWIIEKCVEAEPVETEITFTNNPTNGEVVVYWIDGDEEKEYHRL